MVRKQFWVRDLWVSIIYSLLFSPTIWTIQKWVKGAWKWQLYTEISEKCTPLFSSVFHPSIQFFSLVRLHVHSKFNTGFYQLKLLITVHWLNAMESELQLTFERVFSNLHIYRPVPFWASGPLTFSTALHFIGHNIDHCILVMAQAHKGRMSHS